MNNRKPPREFWIDPQACDEDIPNCFDAFSPKPEQGPSQWIYSLVHVRVTTDPSAHEVFRESMKLHLHEIKMALEFERYDLAKRRVDLAWEEILKGVK